VNRRMITVVTTIALLSPALAQKDDGTRGQRDFQAADGKTRAFWERNLRFMTDSSKDGPERGAPAIMPAGMMGDRASVIFAAPEEINKLIEARC
jgi:hypothetical protein